ncbi:uncharacterized protein DS421_18g613600 [Arachis hypogaea]|nr:uncharacterized protein DS421_18g613600 [Arachis hypogaea]
MVLVRSVFILIIVTFLLLQQCSGIRELANKPPPHCFWWIPFLRCGGIDAVPPAGNN